MYTTFLLFIIISGYSHTGCGTESANVENNVNGKHFKQFIQFHAKYENILRDEKTFFRTLKKGGSVTLNDIFHEYILERSNTKKEQMTQRESYKGDNINDEEGEEEEEDGNKLWMFEVQLEKVLEREDNTVPGDERSVSLTCLNDTQSVITGFLQEEHWALEFFDAFGKPGSGILQGELGWLGSFDECLSIVTPKSEVNFQSTYCSATLSPSGSSQIWPAPGTTPSAIIVLGLCMPDTCSDRDVDAIIDNVLQSQNISLQTDVVCYIRNYPLDTEAIVAIVVCSIFACLVVLGTGYDVISKQLSNRDYPSGKPSTETNNRHTERAEPIRGNNHHSHLDSASVRDTSAELKEDRGVSESDANSTWQIVLQSFSLYTNGAKLLNTKQQPGSLTAVHGIRFISMTWVILGHTFASLPVYGSNAGPYLKDHVKRWTAQAILNANLSVDTFFTLSGLLVSYLTLREMKKGGGKLNWVMFYFHRFWRLTPVYMIVLMVYACLLHYFADGPYWAQTGFGEQNCRENWWTNLLYVNNLVNMKNQCYLWGWYLANDMQFYIISPIILLPLYFSEVLGLIVLGVLLSGSIITTGIISRLNNLSAGDLYIANGTRYAGTYLGDTYNTPYCRIGPYLVGMLAGYILYKYNGKLRMNKVRCSIAWLIATTSALAVLYGPYESANGKAMSYEVATLYNCLKRSVWGVAISWVVVACASERGGYVNTLLSWTGFVPLSRLTYTAYLTHPLVIILHFTSFRRIIYLNDINIVYNFLGFLLATYGVSMIASLSFEVPMMGLEKGLLKRKSRKS